MIKETELEILITRRNVTYYKNLGYNVDKIDTKILVKIEDVNPNSDCRITAICECEDCNNETSISLYKYNVNKNRQGYYGCKKCSRKKFKKTCLYIYGDENPMKSQEIKDKIANSNMKKYGVKTTLLEKNTKEKIDQTKFEKYGTTEVLSSKDIREKGKVTLMEKFGVDSFSKTEEFRKLGLDTWKINMDEKLKNYNITDYIINDDKTINMKCDLGHDHRFEIGFVNFYQRKEIQNSILCTVCNKLESHVSGKEIEIVEFIKNNYNGKILTSDKSTLNGKELDIYLPDLNLAFEFNGIYWHSELYKDNDYHKIKTESCENLNINLLHIWEDDYMFKKEIVNSIILEKLNKLPTIINSSNCIIKEINDINIIKKFLNNNHIQSYIKSKINIGLFYKDELVSLIPIEPDDFFEINYNILRFCNKINTDVINAQNTLLEYFIDKYEPREIYVIVDRNYYNHNSYNELNFKLTEILEPDYSYYNNKVNRLKRLNKSIENDFEYLLTENNNIDAIMTKQNYYRVFNAGYLKYKLIIKK